MANSTQSKPPSLRRFRFAAVLLIACGILSLGIHIHHYIYSPPELFNARGAVRNGTYDQTHWLESVNANSNDWPLMTATRLRQPHSERYGFEVEALRNTSLIVFHVTGASAERTRALAAWFAVSFAQSLSNSVANALKTITNTDFHPYYEAPVQLAEAGDKPASPLRAPSGIFAFEVVIACVLLVSGLLLLRASRNQ
jgi:hypothetical protein